jgi:hypothetical protein
MKRKLAGCRIHWACPIDPEIVPAVAPGEQHRGGKRWRGPGDSFTRRSDKLTSNVRGLGRDGGPPFTGRVSSRPAPRGAGRERTMRRYAYVLAVALVALAVPGCNVFSDFGNAECKANNNVGCATGGSPSEAACLDLPGQGFWECNLDIALGAPFPGLSPPAPGTCGVYFCAISSSDAVQQAAAVAGVSTTDPRLTCIPLGTNIVSVGLNQSAVSAMINAPGAPCVGGACNPCDDGQGGTLQSVGENCGGTSMCCQGLTCVGAGASTIGVCQGTPQCAQVPQDPVEECKQACDKANRGLHCQLPEGQPELHEQLQPGIWDVPQELRKPMIDIQMTSTFAPADGSPSRVVTIRISDLREDPDGLWSVAVDETGFKSENHVRIKGADWLNAVEGAAAFLRALVGGRVKDDGGTMTPSLLP